MTGHGEPKGVGLWVAGPTLAVAGKTLFTGRVVARRRADGVRLLVRRRELRQARS